jgi:hypothetical protein
MNELINILKSKGYTVDYEPQSYLNIATEDGYNCEFYPFGFDNDEGLHATYTIDGKETDIDEYLDDEDIELMVNYIEKILKN